MLNIQYFVVFDWSENEDIHWYDQSMSEDRTMIKTIIAIGKS